MDLKGARTATNILACHLEYMQTKQFGIRYDYKELLFSPKTFEMC